MNRILATALAFIVFFSSCQKEISQEIGSPSSGSLQNTAGECLPKNVGGNFVANKVLNDSNFIEVSVDVLVAGSYNIVTDTVNGYYFSGQGSFANTGAATVKLKGNGKPLVAGTDDFFVLYDSSFCSISVTVLPAGSAPGSGLLFPLTNNSSWSYDEGPGTDTIRTVANGTKTLNSKTYTRFLETGEFGGVDSFFYRLEAGTNYFRYQTTDEFAAFGVTFPQSFLEVIFLKENLTTNQTWNSDHNGTAGGLPVTIRFKFTCISANQPMTVNGKNFTNVYHVRLQPQFGTFGTFQDFGGPIEAYYAKGIGRIRLTADLDDQLIRYWQVN